MSWAGKILSVNLSTSTCKSEPLNMQWAEQFLGHRGLASRYLVDRMDPKADALSPGNCLIFTTGSLTGTAASTSGRWGVVTKGALNNAISCSNSGGFFGAEMKFAGWDMVLITGKADKPVYLHVENETAKLLDASELWGKSVWETEDWIKARHNDPMIKIASIGQAGEELVRYACVVNDRDRAAGRSGVGAVMGSKNLKAIAMRGTRGVKVADPKKFMSVVTKIRARLDPAPTTADMQKDGTAAMIDVTHEFGSLPTRNCLDVQFEGTEKVNPTKMHEDRGNGEGANLVRNKACFGCTIACGRVSKIKSDHFSVKDKPTYQVASGGLEYENIYAFGPMVGVDDLEAATFANFASNLYGMDPISLGVTIAAAMELFEAGAITVKETDGLELRFGSAEALVKCCELAGTGQGFGKDLGLGSKLLCEKYGHPEMFMGVKGQEFPGYDTRAMQGMGLAYATSNRGACHMRASPFGSDFQTFETKGKAKIVADTQNQHAAIDSLGLCLFTTDVLTMEDYAAQASAATGVDYSVEKFLQAGERIYTLERMFNNAAGFTKKDDTLPDRMLKTPAKSGAGKGLVTKLGEMLPEYYELRGWDEEGHPRGQLLKKLNLENVI